MSMPSLVNKTFLTVYFTLCVRRKGEVAFARLVHESILRVSYPSSLILVVVSDAAIELHAVPYPTSC